MKAVLPVAGLGTRMFPLGLSTPKCLIPIFNKPLLQWSLEALKEGGVTEVIVVISGKHFGDEIRAFLEANPVEDLKIQHCTQEEQLGTAHVVQVTKDYFQPGEEFFFCYGDDLYGPKNIAAVVQHPGLVVVGKKVTDPEKWGIFQKNDRNMLTKVVEKPKEFVGDLANIGCIKLNTRVFELYEKIEKSPRGEFELTDTLQLLSQEAEVAVLDSVDYWIPVGYPWQILEAMEYFSNTIADKREGTIEEGVKITGNVTLPKSSIIKSGTVIEGNVVIGENTIVGPHAYLRGTVSIGSDCKVGFGVEVKTASIGNKSQVPHLCYIGDSILAEDVNFAGSSFTTNYRHDAGVVSTMVKGQLVSTGRQKFGAVIGEGVRLGAGTIIYPGRKIWPKKQTLPGEIVKNDIME